MALVTKDNLKKVGKERNTVHQKVRATQYTAFVCNGAKYFQIDTYGSPGREMKDKISQSIQLDEESAKALIKILSESFDW